MATQHDPPNKLSSLDPRAISKVHEQYFPELFRFARYRLDSPDHAEDAVSEAFVRLLEAVHRGRGPQTNLRAWLFRTTSNIVNDHYRHLYSHPVDPLESVREDLVSPNAQPDNSDHRWVDLQERMDSLTPDQQQVLQLRFGAGLSLEETAQVMDKRIGAVKSLQFRAIAAMRDHMREGPR